MSETSYTIHDAHIHYDQDVWEALPAAHALRMLSNENISRALVSATPTEGAEKLYRANPEIVIPMLRPYKSWRHRYFWFKDPELKAYLLAHLARVPYRGFGEFHVFGKDADSVPMEQMIELARERKLVLHPHTDLEGMRIILQKAADIVVIWAHGGFDVPVETLRDLLDKYPMLYIELSFREAMLDDEQQLTSQWNNFLVNYPKRFLVGMDTYKPSRWADLPETAAEVRHWLKQLPDDVAVDIARNNLDRLFPR
ncbi:MAG: hypothetical protein OEY89_02845 [Gammaproteobacteria bacterium]|nr:hypothetical protein [Gammaproteobacteria bacterium]